MIKALFYRFAAALEYFIKANDGDVMAGNFEKKEHAFRAFSRDLKTDDFPPVLFFYGAEDYLIDWAAGSLKKKYVMPGAESVDYVKLSEEPVTTDQILEACNTFSMFSQKRIIWVKDYAPLRSGSSKGFGAGELAKLSGYIDSPNESAILIFSSETPDEKSGLVKKLKKDAKAYDFCKLDRTQLFGFAEKRFKAAGVKISREMLGFLIEETGYFHKETEYRISSLANDIQKIIAHSRGGVVTEADITMTVSGDLDTFVFNFLDAISMAKKETAFSLLHNILTAGTDVYAVTGLLVNHFELMLQIKELKAEGMSAAEIAKTLKVHEFRVKKTMGFADKFTIEKIKSILIQLYEIDRSIKTGALEPTMALELLVGRI